MAPKPNKRPKVVDLADYQPISQPSVRSATLWTPAHLRGMQAQADSGDMSRLGDLCEQMIADDRIGELLESLAGDVLGCDLTFEKQHRATIGEAEKSKELEEDWVIGFDDDEITSLGIWTMMAGLAFAKHDPWVQHESRIVPKLKWWHLRQFSYSQPVGARTTYERQWHVRDNDGYLTPIQPGDGTWVMLTRRGEFRPWANGLWRGLAPWWMLKQYAMADWGVHSEKSAKTIVTAQDGVTSDQRKAISKYVYEAAKDAVISLPVGFDMKLIELSANTRDIYEAQIEAANKGFSIAIQGQNLTSDVQGGSRAAAEVHERKEGRKSRYLAKMLSKGLREQSLTWWAEYNFGDRNLAPYPHWHTEPPEDYASKAVGLQTLGDALMKLKTAGYKLSVEQLEEEYGVQLEEREEPEPQPIAPQPGNPPPPRGKQPPPAPPPAKKKPVPAQAFLASGDDPADAQGLIRGQVYVDQLTDKQTALAADELSAFVDRVAQAVEGAEDYEQVRYAVIKAFAAEQDPDRLVELIEHGILLANLAGRNAVQEDAPDEHLADALSLSFDAKGGGSPGGQPRVPAGNPAGGQWTKGAGVSETAVRNRIDGLQPEHARGAIQSADRGHLDEAANGVKRKLKEDETSAVIGWTGFSYQRIRAADMGDPKAKPDAIEKANTLRRLTEQHAYDATGAMHRGMRVDAATASKLLDAKAMNVDSMSSWTASTSIARSFAHGETGTAGKETSIPVILTMTRARGLSIGGQEAEMLVGKASYRIVSRSNDKGVLRIHIEPADAASRGPAPVKGRKATTKMSGKAGDLADLDLERFGSDGDDVSFPDEDEDA